MRKRKHLDASRCFLALITVSRVQLHLAGAFDSSRAERIGQRQLAEECSCALLRTTLCPGCHTNMKGLSHLWYKSGGTESFEDQPQAQGDFEQPTGDREKETDRMTEKFQDRTADKDQVTCEAPVGDRSWNEFGDIKQGT